MRELVASVIGLGVGEQHARVYARLENCVLRWVCDINDDRMVRIINDLGQGTAAKNIDVILADKSVDVVSIATYDDAHFEQTCQALNAGKHVFVEKPMCRSMKELRDVKRAWEENGKPRLASNLVLRAAPLYQWLKRAIDKSDLGEIYAFDGDYLYGRLHKITDDWRMDVEEYSVMQGGGIHLLDLMLWLTGQKPASVTARGNRICTAGTGFRYNDYVSTTFQFPSGLIGRITANFGCVHRHHHVVRVFGTRGTFIYDDMGPRLHQSRDPSLSAKLLDLPALPATKGDLIPDFVASILKGKCEEESTQLEFDLVSTCIAADQALATNSSFEIDYI